jgi:hypothetical protein
LGERLLSKVRCGGISSSAPRKRIVVAAITVVMAAALTLPASALAALPSELPDQTLMVNGPVRTFAQVPGTNLLWVGGNFTQVQQRDGTVVANVSNVAVFNSATDEYVDIAPMLGAGQTGSKVTDIVVHDDDVVIGGTFSGPTSRKKNLVAVDGATGISVEPIRWFLDSEPLASVLATPDGKVYGGGVHLSAFDFATGNRLWRGAKTVVDDSLRPHVLAPGYRDLELEADGSTIWAACGCDFVTAPDGTVNAARALVKLDVVDSNTGQADHDPSWVARGGIEAFGISVVNTPDKLYLGAGGSDYLAEYPKTDSCGNLTDNLIDWCWQRDTSGSAQVVEVMDGQLVIGGHFWEVADQTGEQCGSGRSLPTLDPNNLCQTRKGLAAYKFDGTLNPNWDPVLAGKYNLAWALYPENTLQGSRLHVGGEFLTVSGVKQAYYGRLSVDTTPPTIAGVSPRGGATELPLGAKVEATFSEAMDAASVTDPANFTLIKQDGTPEGTQVAAHLSYDPATKKATLDPDADLDPQSSYTATIKGGTDGVKDSSGNPLANDELWSFTTTLPCTISGTPSAETITGTSADDVICAGGGNDTIKGLEGNDTIRGEGGTDQLYGELGDDDLDGGLGTDTANFSGSVASVIASLADGTATGEGSDSFSNIESLFGSNQADTLSGSEANNTLNGAGGADSIVGLGGSDALKGSGGGDTLDSRDGVEGNDTVDGGTGTDTCLSDPTELSIVGCEQ